MKMENWKSLNLHKMIKMFNYLGEDLKEKKALEIGSGDGLLATLSSILKILKINSPTL